MSNKTKASEKQRIWYRLPKVYVLDNNDEDDNPEPVFEYADDEWVFFRYPIMLEKIRNILFSSDGFHDGYAEDFNMPYIVDNRGDGYYMFFRNIRQRNDLITEALGDNDEAKRIISWLDDGK